MKQRLIRSHKRTLTSFLGLFLAMALLASCGKSGVKSEGDDAFISPSGEAAAPLPDDAIAGAGDQGVPSKELQMVFFPFDSSVLSPEANAALKENANYLRDNPTVKVQVEGHCDERGTVEYNLALGERRAKAVSNKLKKLGVAATRLSTISYGKERPMDPGHDEAAWGKNRRASFVIAQ